MHACSLRGSLWLVPLAFACSPSSHAAPKPTPSTPPAACATPEHRQLDFWVGEWDVAIRARPTPTSETWNEAQGTQRVEAILGGCAIAEHFTAHGPRQPWAGKSYSVWVPKLGKWRQTWVDDSGNYLAFTGGREGDDFILYGEPRDSFQMRMVFSAITPAKLRWEWQRSEDNWASNKVMMSIDYARSR